MRRREWWLVGMGLWALAAAAGCLERKETIKVARDGAVAIELEYSGKPEQFKTADAMPSQEAGWPVRRTVEKEDNGEEVIRLTAQRRFEPREDLPSHYAAPGDPDARLYTQFPTEIRMDRRADGVYLQFRRTYLPRPWAYVEYWRDQLIDDDLKKLSEKPVEEMSTDEKIRLVQASAGIEFYKQLELAKLALREVDPNLPQDVWLRARSAMVELAEETDWEALIARLVQLPEERRADAFEAEADRLLDATYSTLVGELARAAKWDDAQARAFADAYVREETRYNITSDLGAHAFKITVEMPGEIVAHNADRQDGNAVEWQFSGEAFRDRPYELLVTARLGK